MVFRSGYLCRDPNTQDVATSKSVKKLEPLTIGEYFLAFQKSSNIPTSVWIKEVPNGFPCLDTLIQRAGCCEI